MSEALQSDDIEQLRTIKLSVPGQVDIMMKSTLLIVFLFLALSAEGKMDMVGYVNNRVDRINNQLHYYDNKFFKAYKFKAEGLRISVVGRTPILLTGSKGAKPDHFEYLAEQVCFHWGILDLISSGIRIDLDIWDRSNKKHQLVVNLDDCMALTNAINSDVTPGPMVAVEPPPSVVP